MTEYLLLILVDGQRAEISVPPESTGLVEIEKLRAGDRPYDGRFLRADGDRLIHIDQIVTIHVQTSAET